MSNELQNVALVGMTHDSYLLSKCVNIVTDNFFEDSDFKLIYRGLRSFYTAYNKVPTITELRMSIEQVALRGQGNAVFDVEKAKQVAEMIYNEKIQSEEYVYSQITEFIRRNNIEKSLSNVVDYLSNGKLDLDKVAVELQNSLNITFGKLPIIKLSDSEPTHLNKLKSEALGSAQSPITVKMFIDSMNDCMQYGALIPGTLNMVTASPGSGKTTWLINQGLRVANDNLNVLHVFLGDMTHYDGVIRYLSCHTGVPSSKLVAMDGKELSDFITENNQSGRLSKVFIASYAADQLTTSQLIEEICEMQKNVGVHFNAVIIDYDENIVVEADSMYASGGQIYNKIALFAVMNKSVVFIASQPKPEYWKYEILPMEAASESSKKQKIIDLMITMGKPHRDSSVATVHIAKNRRGVTGKTFRVKIDGETAQISHITEDVYTQIKTTENNMRQGTNNNNGGNR